MVALKVKQKLKFRFAAKQRYKIRLPLRQAIQSLINFTYLPKCYFVMFNFKEEYLDNYTKLTIYDEQEKMEFSVCPEAGATVLDLAFDGHHILEGYATGEDIEERSLSKSAVLFPFPNRLKDGKFKWKGTTYQWPINDPKCQNAIHGFVRYEEFRVKSVEITRYQGTINLVLPYRASRPYFPFEFDLEMSYTLQQDKFFVVDVSVTNVGEDAFPFGFGWHPYFKFDANPIIKDISMRWPEDCSLVHVDKRMLPTGELTPFNNYATHQLIGDAHFDNCFKPKLDFSQENVCRIFLKDEDANIEVSARGQEFPFFQVFTPPGRNCIAVEHMTCNVNGFNNKEGLQTLKPGKTWKGAIWIKYQRLRSKWSMPTQIPVVKESNVPEPGPALQK
jgi:aldose 1-epimerase